MTAARKPRRIGNWTYDPGHGWRLDGQPVLIDFDPLDRSWHPVGGPRHLEPIDRYHDTAMRWVEEHLADYLPTSTGGRQR